MKLSKAESKALKFVLFLVALSAYARWQREPAAIAVDDSAVAAAPFARVKAAGPLDPNGASVAELDGLPGIGRATAEKIVASRPYRTLDDLAAVIGKKRATRLAPRLSLKWSSSAADRARISVNRATARELEGLPGVGPALAKRIAARRDTIGGFRSWEQLDSVKGIGPALLAKIKAVATL